MTTCQGELSDEDEETAAVLRQAEEDAEQVRAEVVQPLTVQARQDGAAYLDAVADEATAMNPRRQAHATKNRAALLRSEADELRALPINDAAHLIEAKQGERENQKRQAAERARQLHDPFEHDPRRSEIDRDGPARGL